MRALPEELRREQISQHGIARFIRWTDGYKNGTSRCELECIKCSYHWYSTAVTASLARNGCPKCKRVQRISADEYIDRINGVGKVRFIRWYNSFKNATSRVIVKCNEGHEYDVTLNCLLHLDSGCPKCHPRHKLTYEYYESKLRDIDNVNFIKWLDVFRGKRTRVMLTCDHGHKWSTTVGNVVSGGESRCPRCSKYGFDQSSPAVLYALESECGRYMKIGITKNKSQRLNRLRKCTPFPFVVFGTTKFNQGYKARETEYNVLTKFDSAELSGFSGSTEWLVNSHELRDYLSNIMTRG